MSVLVTLMIAALWLTVLTPREVTSVPARKDTEEMEECAQVAVEKLLL